METTSHEDDALHIMDAFVSESISRNEDGTYSQTDPFTMSQKSALMMINTILKEHHEFYDKFQSDEITERIRYWLKIKEVIENM